jgi:hypothetical protein
MAVSTILLIVLVLVIGALPPREATDICNFNKGD